LRIRRCGSCGVSIDEASRVWDEIHRTGVCPRCHESADPKPEAYEYDPSGRRLLHVPRDVVWFAWASTIVETMALLWRMVASEPFPVPGLARFAALPAAPLLWWVSLLCSVWLSVRRWHTEGRMVSFAWLAGAVGVPSALFFSLSFFGYPLTWAAFGVWRALRRRRIAIRISQEAQLAASAARSVSES
jgi:hypothetical protein